MTDSLDILVADLLKRYPDAAEVFLAYRMSCLGCEMSGFETLGDALRIYHIPAGDFLSALSARLGPDWQNPPPP